MPRSASTTNWVPVAGTTFVVPSFNFYGSDGGFDLSCFPAQVPFFLVACLAESRFVLFFGVVDFFLGERLQRGLDEFSSFGDGDGFGAVEKLTDGCILCVSFHVSIEGEGILDDESFGFGLRSNDGGCRILLAHSDSFQGRGEKTKHLFYLYRPKAQPDIDAPTEVLKPGGSG